MLSLNQAFALRVKGILKEKKMTQYKLEQLTGIYHGSMTAMLKNKIKASNFRTMAIIIRELGLTITDFFNDPVFNFDNLDID